MYYRIRARQILILAELLLARHCFFHLTSGKLTDSRDLYKKVLCCKDLYTYRMPSERSFLCPHLDIRSCLVR